MRCIDLLRHRASQLKMGIKWKDMEIARLKADGAAPQQWVDDLEREKAALVVRLDEVHLLLERSGMGL